MKDYEQNPVTVEDNEKSITITIAGPAWRNLKRIADAMNAVNATFGEAEDNTPATVCDNFCLILEGIDGQAGENWWKDAEMFYDDFSDPDKIPCLRAISEAVGGVKFEPLPSPKLTPAQEEACKALADEYFERIKAHYPSATATVGKA